MRMSNKSVLWSVIFMDSQANDILNPIDVSIVCVNWNVSDKLLRCIDSVIATVKGVSYEMFIIDNCSEDMDFNEIINKYSTDEHLTFLKNEVNEGVTVINKIKGQTKGRYLLILGPDTVLKNDTIKDLIGFMDANKDAGAASARLVNPDNSPQYYVCKLIDMPMIFYTSTIMGYLIDLLVFKNSKMHYYMEEDRDVEVVTEVDQPAGACLIIRESLLADDEYIVDPDFPFYFNDVDLCKRIHDKGFKIYIVPAVEVIHDKSSSFKKKNISWARENSLKSLIVYFKKHYPRKTLPLKSIIISDSLLRIMLASMIKLSGITPKYKGATLSVGDAMTELKAIGVVVRS